MNASKDIVYIVINRNRYNNVRSQVVNQPSLIILLSFFGKFPWYFTFFLNSCRYNPGVRFYIITDNKVSMKNKPHNVSFVQKTLNQIQEKATKKLGISARLHPGYKICDFRPLFGYLFPELIQGYHFWGYGDIDVLYGDIRYFLNNSLLNSYDIFSFRPEYLTGSFTVCRNSSIINRLFMESRDYEKVISSEKYFNFDECNFMFAPLHAGEAIEKTPSKIESMTHVVRKKHDEGYLRAYFDFNLIEGVVGNLKWTQGRIIYKNQFEAILYHLLKFKDSCKRTYGIPKAGDTICFSKKTIYKM